MNMGIIILLILLIIVSLACVYYGKTRKGDIADAVLSLGVLCGTILILIFIGVLCDIATLPNKHAQIHSEYHNLNEQLIDFKRDNIVVTEGFRDKVLNMNNTIAEHRNYYDNIWVGIWYSEEIGKLKNLKCNF